MATTYEPNDPFLTFESKMLMLFSDCSRNSTIYDELPSGQQRRHSLPSHFWPMRKGELVSPWMHICSKIRQCRSRTGDILRKIVLLYIDRVDTIKRILPTNGTSG